MDQNSKTKIRHGAEGSLGRCINSCSFLVVPRWRECLPPLPASISLLCSSRLGQQSCALWSRILGPWTLKGAESTEEVSCDTGNWNHKDIRHIGTPKKEIVAFCCILYVFRFHNGFIMFHDISRHILSHILNMFVWNISFDEIVCEEVSIKILMTWDSMIFENLPVFTTKLEFQDVPSLCLWVYTVYV